MLTIGLTGGIGSGKSTVAKLFEAKNIAIIDTDEIAHELVMPGKEALEKILQKFGKTILLSNGVLNRVKLRKVIFSDSTLRAWLENLLHPKIRNELQHRINKAQSPYCIAVIPLLFETAPNPLINRILIVDTSEKLQLQRAQARDHTPLKVINAILRTQVTREERKKGAHDIIYNEGGLAGLTPQVEKLHQYYLSITHSK